MAGKTSGRQRQVHWTADGICALRRQAQHIDCCVSSVPVRAAAGVWTTELTSSLSLCATAAVGDSCRHNGGER